MPRVLHHLFLAVYFLFSDFFLGGGECNKNTILKKSRVLGYQLLRTSFKLIKHLKNTVK